MSKKGKSNEDLGNLLLKQKYELLRKKQVEDKKLNPLEEKKKEIEKRLELQKLIKKNQAQEELKKKTGFKKPQINKKLHEESLGFIPKAKPPTENNESKLHPERRETTEETRTYYNPGEDRRFSNNNSNNNNREGNSDNYFKKKRLPGARNTFNNNGDSDLYPSTVFVGDLSDTTEQHHLEELFQQYGKLEAVRIIQGKNFGFVKYFRSPDAQKAIEGLNGQTLCGSTIRVSAAKVPQQEKRWHGPPNQHWDSNVQHDRKYESHPDFQDHIQRQKFYGHQGDEDDIPSRELIVYDI